MIAPDVPAQLPPPRRLPAARTRDVAGAEDALSEAFAAALRRWPVDGVPDNPDAWLLTAARRRQTDAARRRQTRKAGEEHLQLIGDEIEAMADQRDAIPDRRLALMFACAHPAIERGMRTPLILQTILGQTAEDIAAAFLIPPATMGQRLARAKTRIRDAGIPFRVPDPEELPERLAAVLDAIYAAHTKGWNEVGDDAIPNSPARRSGWAGWSSPSSPTSPKPQPRRRHCPGRRGADLGHRPHHRRGGEGITFWDGCHRYGRSEA